MQSPSPSQYSEAIIPDKPNVGFDKHYPPKIGAQYYPKESLLALRATRARRPKSLRDFVEPAVTVLAERVGFEPTVLVKERRFSRPVHSTALPPLRPPDDLPERRCGRLLSPFWGG
jgi:hypothetical protein